MTRFGVKGARKSVQWTDFSPERAKRRAEGPTVFTKNWDRLLTTNMSRKVMAAILSHGEVAPLLSDDHFTVDGTLIKQAIKTPTVQARWRLDDDEPGETEPETAPMPRSTRHNRNFAVDFKGEKRSNKTRA